MGKKTARDSGMQTILAGRTLDEQTEHIRKDGSHGTSSLLRRSLFKSLGITEPKEKAENLIMFGCYLPFTKPLLTKAYLQSLEHLGIEYTYLDKEYCCGLPIIEMSQGTATSIQTGKEFMGMNRALAKEKGAKNIVYCCVWCAHLAKRFFPDEAERHMFYPDLILERLEKEILRISPAVMGYYEGCHTRYRAFWPNVNLDWGSYRRLLDKIEGLKIVDLPHRVCCMVRPERILEEADKKGVHTIVCTCNSCHLRLKAVADGRVQIKYLPEILLEAMGETLKV